MASRTGDRPPFAVVGAGAQGLAFALSLARRGEKVLVLERSGEVGGQARSFRQDGFTFDFGLHAFVSRDRALLALAREVLGADWSSFVPRAATRLASGAVVEDSACWTAAGASRPLWSLLGGEDAPFNCMQVARPPRIVYPRRGGFGRLFERMAAAVVRAGGEVRLGVEVDPRGFEVSGRRVVAMRAGGRTFPVAGVCWSAGSALLSGRGRHAADGETLVFHHFRVRGEPLLPHHWVRLEGVDNPLLPKLVYFPARFSPANAPRGFHGVGAVVPLAPARSGRAAGLARWASEDPAVFRPLVTEFLGRAGLLDPARIVGGDTRSLPAPPPRARRTARHPYEGLENFLDADLWAPDARGDSGVPLQMAAALRAAESAA